MQYIQENFAQEIGLADIANAARVSPYHLARLFKQVTGVTPHQYLIGVRVDNARALLSAGAGKRSIADIAEAVGFADQSHLTRHVKRLLGVTPRELARLGAGTRRGPRWASADSRPQPSGGDGAPAAQPVPAGSSWAPGATIP